MLNLGAYDVLSKPFDRAEVLRIISLAWLHWKEEASTKTAEARRVYGCRGRDSEERLGDGVKAASRHVNRGNCASG